MASNVIKIIDSQDKVVSQTQVASGKSVTVSAKEGQSYEFVSGATKRAPDEIKTTREGNNLKVEIKDGDATSTVVVEDYYTNGEGDLIGLAEDGHFYNFVPEEMGTDYMVTDLADGVSSFQALGSEGDSMSPWWLGLPLLALGAAGGGGGSGSANTLPDAPNLTMVEDDYDAQKDSGLWGRDKDTGQWEVKSDGTVSVVDDGDDTTNVNIKDGKIITNDNTPSFIVSDIESGSTIDIYDYDAVADTYTLVESTMVENTDGTWSVTVNEETASGDSNVLSDGEHTLFLIERNAADNALDPENGTQIDIVIDTTLPLYNSEINIADANARNNRSSDLADNEKLEQNYYFTNEIILSDDALKATYNGTEDVPYAEGDSIYITLYNENTGVTYLIKGEDGGPSVVVGSDGQWSVTIYNNNNLDGTSGPLNAYNTTDGEYQTLADGEYSGGILIYEASGNTRNLPIDSFAIDTTAPTANNVEYVGTVNNNSSVIASDSVAIGGHINGYNQLSYDEHGGDNGNGIMERDHDYLIGTGPAEIFISRDGVQVGSKYVGTDSLIDNPDADNWSFVETLDDGVYKYEIETMDVAGNSSDSTKAFWVIVDNGGTHSYDLMGVDDIDGKDFEHMVLVGNSSNETFTLDNVGFTSIDGGTGTDTFTLQDGSGSLDITQTANFEVYNMGDNTLDIGSNVVNGDADNHVTVNGTGNIELDSSWHATGFTTGIYTIYESGNGSDALWIETSNVSNVTIG